MEKATKIPISSTSFRKGVALGGYKAGAGWRRKAFPMLVASSSDNVLQKGMYTRLVAHLHTHLYLLFFFLQKLEYTMSE